MPGSNHEMPKDVVPPGDQTGVYYIPISNLPFNVSWQQIKDHVRQVCEVDHVEVFQKSTCGWVRVKGRENFEAAYRHLDGQELNGRSLCADSRNGEGPILVRDLLLCKPSASSKNRPSTGGGKGTVSAAPESPVYAQGGPVSYPDASILSSPTSTTSSSLSQGRVDGYNMSMSSSFMTSPDSSYPHPTMMHGYDGVAGGFPQPASLPTYGFGPGQVPMQSHHLFPSYSNSHPDGSQAMYPTQASYAVQPPYGDYYPPVTNGFTNQMAAMSLSTATPNIGSAGVIYTEQRGIQIRNISQRASKEQVHKMIAQATGPESHLIHSIEVPADKDGNSRRLAFVHYRNASLARRMAGHLDGVEFMGRKLQVRLMKDGDAILGNTSSAASSSSSSQSSKTHRSSKQQYCSSSRRDDKRKDKYGPSSAISSKTSPPSKKSNTPLVVGGSIPTSSSNDKGKGKGKEVSSSSSVAGGGKKTSGVVIVDGSSGRRPSHSERR